VVKKSFLDIFQARRLAHHNSNLDDNDTCIQCVVYFDATSSNKQPVEDFLAECHTTASKLKEEFDLLSAINILSIKVNDVCDYTIPVESKKRERVEDESVPSKRTRVEKNE